MNSYFCAAFIVGICIFDFSLRGEGDRCTSNSGYTSKELSQFNWRKKEKYRQIRSKYYQRIHGIHIPTVSVPVQQRLTDVTTDYKVAVISTIAEK
jgi:hypothetical protein